MNKDLTVEKPETVLWQFCLPLFGSIIFQQLYNLADSLVAGKFVGEAALAAVGNSYEVTLIFIAFAFGCNIGCSVVVSQLFGYQNRRVYHADRQRRFVPAADAAGHDLLHGLAGVDPHAGKCYGRLPPVSGYLYPGPALRVLL